MPEAILDYVINVLETDPDVYAPVKRLWYGLQDQGLDAGSYDHFLAWLQNDPRFVVEPAVEDELGEPPPWPPEEEPEMEALGFYLGPRVKLAARELTADHLAAILERHTGNLMSALEGAWALRDPHDREAEDLLIEALAKAQQLQRETRSAIQEALKNEPGDAPDDPE
jgi:hypothetical protein